MTTPPNDALSTITVRGARENNLRDIDIDLPKRSLIVFAGVVGYLAFDHAPDAGALIGMAVIIASGLCMAYVQRRQPAAGG